MLTTTLIIIALLVALAVILLYAASKPDTFAIQRSATIAAPPDKIFPLINDLHAHTTWSPFEKDPAMKRTHSGAPAGKGAIYEWDGNRQVGSGRIAITDSSPSSKVAMRLEMFRPFKADNVVEFTLEPQGNPDTRITWAMRGQQPFMAKLMSTFINCDKMVGSQFEEGLAKLKVLAEAKQQTPQETAA
jgi:uncharacterized protein YndB with AHSA1/START domain